MAKEINPFIVIGRILPEYFCDRVDESERLIRSITNGNNVVLISPRRMGKTGLIQFCYEKPQIKEDYYTFFIDILHTTSLKEFTYILGKAVYDTLLSRSKKMAIQFIQTLKSINAKFGYDSVTNMPAFSLGLGDINNPEYTLSEIFKTLENADKPCIVAIDEFQQISRYPEKNIEALLRTYIQQMTNSNFIFAGSERGIMQSIFSLPSRPFYNSSDILELNAIEKPIYVKFILDNFAKFGKIIKSNSAELVYDIFKGHTFYIQKTFNEAFSQTQRGDECTEEIIAKAIDSMIAQYDTIFREILSQIPERQKDVLYAIAKEGEAKQILSAEFINKYRLSTASSIQAAIKKLIDKDLITERFKSYIVTDKLFAMWINRVY